MSGPHCLQCGRPIPKRTKTVMFSHQDSNAPKSKAECQQQTNGKIVSVRYWGTGRVSQFSVWDGESYIDPHFCQGSCAALFGRRAARAGVRL